MNKLDSLHSEKDASQQFVILASQEWCLFPLFQYIEPMSLPHTTAVQNLASLASSSGSGGSSAFGASSAKTSGSGGFGSGGGFGSSTPKTSAFGSTGGFGSFGSFGSTAQSQQQEENPLLRRLAAITKAYDQKSPNQFTALVYSIQKKQTQISKPVQIDDDEWDTVMRRAPTEVVEQGRGTTPQTDDVVPIPLFGFKQLKDWEDKQKQLVDRLEATLKAMQNEIAEIRKKELQEFEETLGKLAEEVQKKVMTLISKKKGTSMAPLSKKENEMYEELQKIDEDCRRFKSELKVLTDRAEFIKKIDGSSGTAQETPEIPKLGEVIDVVKSTNRALEGLEEILKKTERTITEYEQTIADRRNRYIVVTEDEEAVDGNHVLFSGCD